MLKTYRAGLVPPLHNELAPESDEAVKDTIAHLRGHQLQAALQRIGSLVTRGNQYVEQTAPFKLAKDPTKAARLDQVLYNLAEACRVLAVLLWPFIPTTAEKIYTQLGLTESPDKMKAAAWGGLNAGHRIGELGQLFPRKDLPLK